MATTYVTFDTRSGQIVSVHHGALDAEQARLGAQRGRQADALVQDEYIAVIPISAEAFDQDKLYKVDVGSQALVAATAEDGGVAFDFGAGAASS